MISRSTLIVALVAVEFAILGEAVLAVSGGQAPGFAQRADARSPSVRLVEGGAHRVYEAGAHPALSVDIGYADLKIVATKTSQIDVSVSPSTEYGAFQATGPITAREDGDTVRIASTGGRGWSMGDDRLVTVFVPAGTKINVKKAGEISASGLRADVSLNSIGNGAVTVDDLEAATLTVTSSRGRITLHQIVATRLEAKSSDAGVEGTALDVRDGSIESGDRVSLGFAPAANTRITAEASDGHIHLAGFDSAPSGGTAKKSDDDDDSSSQTIQVGSGAGHLDVHTSDGNITLAKEN